MVVKVQTPIVSNAPNPPAMVYDQTRKFQMFIEKKDLPDWNWIVERGGKAFYLARISDDGITLIRRVSDRTW